MTTILLFNFRFIYVANYGGGSFTAFKLNADSSIGSVMLNDVYGQGSGADPEGRQVGQRMVFFYFNQLL